MFENKINKTVTHSLKLIIIIVFLTWMNHYAWLLKLNTKADFLHNSLLYPIIISILAIVLALAIYIQAQRINWQFSNLIKMSRNTENANLSKSQFLDNMSHELRTPMIGILGSTDLLEHSLLDAEQHLHLDTIKDCGEKLLHMIDAILDMSKIDLDGVRLKSDLVNVAENLAEAQTSIMDNRFNEDLNNHFLPINILLVEDNELNQKLIMQMLSSYGFEVEAVNNGLECLQILQEKDFHLILMDMQMPVLDGYETTRKIRANSGWSHIPVIAITANALSYDRDKCLACGCSSYLAKPFKTNELVAEIKAQLKTDFVRKSGFDPYSNELINQLLPEFIEILAEMLEELHDAIENRDMQSIQQQSHAIKGTAGMYGFIQISEISALIEQAGRDKLYLKIPPLFDQMKKSYQQIITRQNANVVG